MNTYRLPSLILVILLVSALFAALAAAPASAQTTNMKHFIFRDDDIAPFSPISALKAVNQVHIDQNVPVTLGIVPHPDANFSGNALLADNETHSYLQSLAMNPLFEFAQHGYTHRDNTSNTVGASTPRMVGAAPYQERLVEAAYSEFNGRPYVDQYDVIKKGRDDIIEALGVTPTTFIPPWNSGDTNTLKACTALSFTLYSTGYDDFSVCDATLQGIRVQAANFSMGWATTSEWQTNMPKLINDTDAALNGASSGQNFVLFYHYWQMESSDGSIDPVRLSLFKEYIDHLKNRGDVQFSTLANQNAPGSADVFVHGTDDALWYNQRSGQYWSAWASLGGHLNSSPAAVSWGDGRIDVFVRGSDGALWHRWYASGVWHSWESLGGQLLPDTGPAASSWVAGRLDVFVIGTDNRLWHKSYQNGWSSWESLGGSLTASPAAVSWGTGRIDIFVRGTDGAVWNKYYQKGWSSWKSAGGQLALNMGPAVSSWSAGRLDVFAIGTDNRLWHKSYQNGWSSWESLGGGCTSPPAATSGVSGRIDVFVRGSDGALWQKVYNGGWLSWTSLGGKIAANTGPAACS